MAWAHVQSTSQRVASGANAKAYATAVTAGSLLLCGISIDSSSATITSVVDNNGNTWTAIGSLSSYASVPAVSQVFYAKNANAGATTVTVTPSAGHTHMAILEYSGLDTSAPFDVSVVANNSGTAPSSGSTTTTAANELIVGWFVGTSAFTVGSGFTDRINTSFDHYIHVSDKNSGSAGSYSADATAASSAWIVWMVTFKEPGAGGGGAARAAVLAARRRSAA